MLLVLIALTVLLLSSDETRKEWLIAGASYAMDRKVEINGDFSVVFGSTVMLHATDIRVANAEWGGYPDLFQTRQLDASMALWPLLRGALDLSLSLSSPELMLETGETGIGNWNFDETTEESTDSNLPLTISPREITVTNGRFFYREYAVEHQDKAEIERFHLAMHEHQRVLDLAGHFNELPLSLKSEQSAGQEAETGTATRLFVDGQIGRLNIQAEGTAKGAIEQGDTELDLAIAFESPSLRIVDGQLGQILPDLGPLKGQARLHGSLSAPVLKEIAATLDSTKGKLKVSGAIGNVLGMRGFDMKVDADTPNLTELLRVFGVETPLTIPHKTQAEARLSGDWPDLVLSDIKARTSNGISNAVMSGQINDLLDLDGVDIRGNVTAPTLADLPPPRQFQNNELPEVGPVKGSVHITANDGLWSASELRIDVENESGWIRYRAEITNLATMSGLDSALQAKLRSLDNLQVELPPGAAGLGPVEFSATLKEDPAGSGKLIFHGKTTSEKLELVTKGSIGELLADDEIAFNFELTADQLSDIGQLLGRTLAEVGPVHSNGRLVIQGDLIKLEQLEAKAGKSDLAGHIAFSLANNTDNVFDGRLTSNTLDLGELLPEQKAVEVTVLKEQKIAETSADTAIPPAERYFQTDPLPLEDLRQIRTRIELDLGKVITRQQLELDKLKIGFSLVDGVLAVQPFSAQIGGEPVELEMTLDASKSPAAFKFSTHGDDIKVTHLRSLISKTGLEGGQLFFHVDVQGEGDSIAAIMGSLDGSVAFAIADSRLTDVSANKLDPSLEEQINPERQQDEPNILECGAIYFEIKDGIATTTRGLAAQFDDVTWLGNGEINLVNEQIQISARPRTRKGLGIMSLNHLAKLVLLGGTLSQPVIYLDPAGVAGAYADYAAAIYTGGLSLLLKGLLDKSEANERVCLQIMDPQVETHSTEPGSQEPAPRILKPKPPAKETDPSGILDQD